MGFAIRRVVSRPIRRRMISAALLAIYVVTASGVPLPAGNSSHPSGELYPCAAHECGCTSAEQCWRSCCCHTLAERFEWARQHQVRPPEYAIAEARRSGVDLAWLKVTTTVCAACEKPSAEPGADEGLRVVRVRCSCCERHVHTKATSKTVDHVIAWRALECKGHSANWLAAVPTLIVSSCRPSQELPLIDWLGPAQSERADRTTDLPAIPPPKTV